MYPFVFMNNYKYVYSYTIWKFRLLIDYKGCTIGLCTDIFFEILFNKCLTTQSSSPLKVGTSKLKIDFENQIFP